MKIPQQGLNAKDVMQELNAHREGDIKWREGKTFSYIYDAGEEVENVCKEAYLSFLSESGLDPLSFRSLLQLEKDVSSMAKNHLGGDENVVGSFSSGGTESIILAVKAARDYARAEKNIAQPEIIFPVTAHAAFHKAAHYLDVKAVVVPVNQDTCKPELDAIRGAINENTVLIVGSAPSYAHGVIDPIREMGALAQEYNLLFHVDGCIGGFLLPYFRKLGVDVADFDFSVPGVTSISMDFHKYAYVVKGASIVLYKNKNLRKYQFYACADWTGYPVVNPTVQSSKSGGPVASTWATLRFLGEDGYLDLAQKLHEATQKFVAGVEKIDDLQVMGTPEMTLVAVKSNTINIFHVVDEMKVRGWHIQAQLAVAGNKENFHLTIQPSNVALMDNMVRDLEESVKAAKELPLSPIPPQLQSALMAVASGSIAVDNLGALLQSAGIDGDKLPERTATINTLLNHLPCAIRNQVLLSFFNELFSE
ncbi:aspartate aminotransferase family protein [Candidatus Uabimicrobium sp. HlEnr_7]|uniref:pyridoxal phosphate-dependent decarboxylase family protein n=1 Tax=Candidatus Uabimicrobium helgolandensis TaxID=3095367 RepID=UPI003556DD1D